MKKTELLDQLDQRLLEIDEAVESFKKLSEKELLRHPSEADWNALQNIEHLKRYNAFYINEFQKTLKRTPDSNSEEMNRGKFGMKSAKSMLPTEDGVDNPMRTFRSKNPKFAKLDKSVLDEFEKEQVEMKEIVKSARTKDIGAVKCKTTLPLIRFIFVDALEFVINHQVRHIAQAKRALQEGS